MKSKIGIIIGREFNERVQKKSFIFTTLLTPLLMLLLIFAPMLISGYSDDTTKTVAVVDETGVIAQQLTSSDEIQFEHTQLPLEIARNEYSNCYAILHIGRDIINNPSDAYLYTTGTAAMGTEHNISAQLTMAVQKEKMKLYNVEQQVIQELNTHVMPQSLKNSPSNEDAESSSAIVASVLAYILSFILYMFLLLYGVMVMQSVIEEKNNRVLEVLVSTVRPFDMMMGKILGIASVALLQIIIWILFIAGMAYFVLPHILPEEILTAMEMLKQGVPAAALDGGAEMGMLQAIMMLVAIGICLWRIPTLCGHVRSCGLGCRQPTGCTTTADTNYATHNACIVRNAVGNKRPHIRRSLLVLHNTVHVTHCDDGTYTIRNTHLGDMCVGTTTLCNILYCCMGSW